MRTHILPPASKHFRLLYVKKVLRHWHYHISIRSLLRSCHVVYTTRQGKLVPGVSEELVVEFTPDEDRDYEDVIRVHVEVRA